jgi:hypothetical protein
VVFVQPDLRVDIERLRQCDAVHVYRLCNKETIAYVDDLHRRGIGITWDNDDDVRLLPAGARKHARLPVLQAEQEFRNQAKLFRRVDVVTTTSATLAERWGTVGATHVIRIPNYLQPDQYAAHDGRRDRVVIGWVAGLEHYVDAEALGISAVLQRVLERHPKAHVVSIGVRLELDGPRYEHRPHVPFPQLCEALRGFDLGLAPIADLPMNHARSDVKIKEYAAAGAAWLASARGPYAPFGAREGGMLVEDDGWEAALEELVGSRLKRSVLRRRAVAWGKTQSVDRHVQEWVDVFEQAIELAQERRTAGRDVRAARA